VPFVRFRLRIAVAVLAISAVGGWAWSANSQPEIDAQMTTPGEVPYPSLDTNDLVVGKQLSDVDVTDLKGNTIALQSFLGSPIILNFWYSTCEPCRREIPAFVQAQQANAGIQFIGLNMNDSPETAKAFAEKYGVNYPIVFDQSGTVVRELGVVTAPSTLFIDSAGNIVDQVAGEISSDKLASLISQWFAS
jgi:peroxiredoxin